MWLDWYFNASTNQPYYYNGSSFVSMAPIVPPVQTVQGLTGKINFTGGTGISLSGTTINNNGVVSLSSATPQLIITNNGQGRYVINTSSNNSSGFIALSPSSPQSVIGTNPSINLTNTNTSTAFMALNGTTVINGSGQLNLSQVYGTLSNSNLVNNGQLTIANGTGITGGATIALGGTVTLGLPNASGTICLSSGNCVGTGGSGSAIGGSGSTDYIAKFTGAGTIGNSLLYDNGYGRIDS